MQLELVACEIGGDGARSEPVTGVGPVGVGPLSIEVDQSAGRTSWSVTNVSQAPVAPRYVRLVHRVAGVQGPLRLFRHGYQSWSPSGVVTFGVDEDPSADPTSFRFVRDAYLCDPHRVAPGELRSELVTALADDRSPILAVGFDAATEHDGTFRLRPGADGPELVVEAFFGGAVIPPGVRRALHPFGTEEGDDASALLESWARRAGATGRARVAAPFQVGWCSWYHYFHDVTEEAIRSNLARSADWPFTVFQVDDGYQRQIGDWLETADTFPSGLGALADDIAASGQQAGIWLAPFLVSPASRVATEHPEWLVQFTDGSGPMLSWFNPPWGGAMWGLDTTRTDVQDHLEGVARSLVAMGYTYLKLDFTIAPGLEGRFHDPTLTPAQRVRAGYDAVRRGAGEDTFLLGCGAPIGPCIGVVDGMRIGADVAPSWPLPTPPLAPALAAIEPATAHAYRSTVTRAFQHRRLWLNDPDCVMLRTSETALTHEQAVTWAHAVGVSGGMAIVSDDLALLDDSAHTLLDEVVEIGRASDAAAVAGASARCDDLLDRTPPHRLTAAGYQLVTNPATGASTLTRPT
jgi:alpha-galactosidase